MEASVSSLNSLAPDGCESLPPLLQAQMHLAHLEAVLSLSQSLCTLQGEGDFHAQVAASEMTLTEAYRKKVKSAVAKEELAGAKRGLEVNIDAAHRFITHALPELSAKQKEELQSVR
jgi:hypothetical protein